MFKLLCKVLSANKIRRLYSLTAVFIRAVSDHLNIKNQIFTAKL